MSPNPIRKVLSSIQKHRVQCLLMGGQACVFYGAAEFSRDIDLTLHVADSNLAHFHALLADLEAECIAVPPFETDYLLRGHAVHFRCHHQDAENLRLDVMAIMRGVDPFPDLWERRSTVEGPDGEVYELLSRPDLVKAKKTQRDKDWPMIRRLVETSYFAEREAPSDSAIEFWLRELRTPQILIQVSQEHRERAEQMEADRPLLALALVGVEAHLREALTEEEATERERDRLYWEPLRMELESLRRASRRKE